MREHVETPISYVLFLCLLCLIFLAETFSLYAHNDFPDDVIDLTHLDIGHPDRIRPGSQHYQHVHEYYTINNIHPLNRIRHTAWWTVEPQNWQPSDGNGNPHNDGNGNPHNDGNGNPHNDGNGNSQNDGNGNSQNDGNGNPHNDGNGNPHNDGNGNSQNDGNGNPHNDGNGNPHNDGNGNSQNDGNGNPRTNGNGGSSGSGSGCTALTGDFVSFTLELKEGYNFISLPFTVIGVDYCEYALKYISDLFHAIQPDVNYIYSVGLDEFTYTSSGGDNPELEPSFGFVIVMTSERTIELHAERPVTTPVEVDFTIRKGYGVYGVPIDSEDLETVEDFFDLFPSVWAIYFQLESQAQVLVQRHDTEYLDESIRGEASYMIHSSAEETVTLEGELWETEPASPAPQVKPTIASVISTWAQLKSESQP